jgi:hypothetical protein
MGLLLEGCHRCHIGEERHPAVNEGNVLYRYHDHLAGKRADRRNQSINPTKVNVFRALAQRLNGALFFEMHSHLQFMIARLPVVCCSGCGKNDRIHRVVQQ